MTSLLLHVSAVPACISPESHLYFNPFFNYLNYTIVGSVCFEVSIFPRLLVQQGVRTSGKNAEQLKIVAGCCQVTSDYSEAFYLLFRLIC